MDGWPLVTVAHDSAHMQLQAGVYGELMKLTYMHTCMHCEDTCIDVLRPYTHVHIYMHA